MIAFTDDRELLAEFVAEAHEHLTGVEGQLLELEAQAESADLEVVNTVFRAVHSVKGAAGFLGLTKVNDLAHNLEEVLNRVRGQVITPTSAIIETLLGAIDRLQELIRSVETSNDEDIAEHVVALERILQGAAVEPGAAQQEADAVAAPTPESGVSSDALREFLIESHENLEQLEKDLLALEQNPASEDCLRGIFRTIHTIKGTAGFLGFGPMESLANAGENLLSSLRARQFDLDKEISNALLALVDALRKQLAAVEGGEAPPTFEPLTQSLLDLHQAKSGAAPATPAATVLETEAPDKADATREAPRSAPPADGAHGSIVDTTIRVDVALLDKLMTRVGELVLARNQILQSSGALSDGALQNATQRLNLITTELQESVMKTRMQPIGNVWGKFPRLVRDLAHACGKQIRIDMTGKETELDKTIIESIKDPLTHLVRNSVDHGLESPAERARRGKPVEGCVGLRAYHEGGQVNIEISDDGAGLNLDRIRAKAVERGLVAAEQAARMSDRESAQLIFLPGFSTAEKVTNISGRGVGMDVVKTNIEKIGGTVDVQTRPGQGTTVKIKIPLTLAIIPALVVSSQGDRYAIPQINLLELVRLDGEQSQRAIEWMHGAPVYRLRGRLLPLAYLSAVLEGKSADASDLQRAAQRDNVNIVVLRADDRQFGLVVDGISDTEEIVVKPLGSQLKGISVYSGATIMGDGRVALILDVLGLAQAAGVVSESHDRPLATGAARDAERSDQHQTLLILGVGADRRVALPISMVARLEEFPRSQLESAGGQTVVQYRGEILRLISLAEVLRIPARPSDDGAVKVVVYAEGTTRLGLIVDAVLDIVDSAIEARCDATSDALTGSAVIQKHVTDLLDVPAIVRRAVPAPKSPSAPREACAV